MMNMERDLAAYISREVMKVFQGYALVAVNQTLPGQIQVDFHLRDKDGTDVFVEVKARKPPPIRALLKLI
jgi:RecB family endonuclease NucS